MSAPRDMGMHGICSHALERSCGFPRCSSRWSLSLSLLALNTHSDVGVILCFKCGNGEVSKKTNFQEYSDRNIVIRGDAIENL